MPVSIREQLLSAITTAVGGVFDTDLPTDERELPITLVADDAESATEDYDQIVARMPVAVARAAAATDRDSGTQRAQANELLAALIGEMNTDETFGGLAQGTLYDGGGIAINNKFVAAEAQFTITYSYVRGDPYTAS